MIRFEFPWSSTAQWKEINQTIHLLIGRFSYELMPAFKTADSIRKNLEYLFPVMDELCTGTCPSCREPCCHVAKLWYNYQDLLFLHLSGGEPPIGQPMKDYHGHCRYLGKTGCTLPRIIRPWICTWYICPPQTSLLKRSNRALYNEVESVIQKIKMERKEMENNLMEVISKV